MKSSRYSPEQVAFALRQAEECTRVSEVCRNMGTRNNTDRRVAGGASTPVRSQSIGSPSSVDSHPDSWRQKLSMAASLYPEKNAIWWSSIFTSSEPSNSRLGSLAGTI